MRPFSSTKPSAKVRFRSHYKGRNHYRNTIEEARAFADRVFAKTGIIVSIVAVNR